MTTYRTKIQATDEGYALLVEGKSVATLPSRTEAFVAQLRCGRVKSETADEARAIFRARLTKRPVALPH